MAEVGGQMVEVVVAGAAQVAAAPVPIEEGVYVAGTGIPGRLRPSLPWALPISS